MMGVMMQILFMYLVVILIGGSSSNTDWTHNCPNGCKCGWVAGRKTAECRDSGFTGVPVGLSDEVQVLDLRGNVITSLRPYVFRDAGLMNLNKIKMNHCGIRRVDRFAFAELTILVELDLSDNQITEVTMESFDTNARLRELYLNGNPLGTLLGTSFPPLLYFQKLSLRNCNLTTIPPRAFEQLVTVEIVDLSGNQFHTIETVLFEHLPKLKSLALHDNPWKCDCRLQPFRDWTLMHNLLTVQPTKCAEPDRLANFEWNQLLTSHFTCSPEIAALQVNGQATDAYIVGDLGKTIRLECLVMGNPPADVRWVKDTTSMTNGTAAASGKSYYVQVSGDKERWVNLTLTYTQIGDAGEYTCVGENKGGSTERNVTLNFQDAPSGAGVGMGLGSDSGQLEARPWIWILIGCLVAFVTVGFLVGLIICVCARKPRKQGRTEVKEIPLQDRSGGEALDEGSKVNPSSMPLLSPTPEKQEDPEYPDLLPRSRFALPGSASPVESIRSRSTLPDTTRFWPNRQSIYGNMQEFNPGVSYGEPIYGYTPDWNPAVLNGRSIQYGYPIYAPPSSGPYSVYSGSVSVFGDNDTPKATIPPNRRGYVTLPRKPRVPWTNPSPTWSGSAAKNDNLGQRTTADGSTQNLNQLGLGSTPTTPQYHSSTLPHAYTPVRGRINSTPIAHQPPIPTYFNFDPIQENELDEIGLPSSILSTNPIQNETPTARKVPPKPPPKPKKFSVESPLPVESSVDDREEGDDVGTEV